MLQQRKRKLKLTISLTSKWPARVQGPLDDDNFHDENKTFVSEGNVEPTVSYGSGYGMHENYL